MLEVIDMGSQIWIVIYILFKKKNTESVNILLLKVYMCFHIQTGIMIAVHD